ncbi:hypothetical protein ACMHYB_33960 [Sorangium sp. So ce1128]
MRSAWLLPEQSSFGIDRREIETVLVEYDEPEVVVLRDATGALFLGVAADESAHAVRWIHAPLPKLEYRALIAGALSLRDSLLKEEVWVVDELRLTGKVDRVWRLNSSQLPGSALPEPGALIPDATRARLGNFISQDPVLYIDGQRIQEHTIPFADLSAIANSTQRLWTALAQSQLRDGRRGARKRIADSSTLSMAATGPGSFAISVQPADREVFEVAASIYGQLVHASDDTQRLRSYLGYIGPEAMSAYASYMRTIEKHRLHVLAEWSGMASYVGAHIAKRVQKALRHTTPRREQTFGAIGHFHGFSYEDNKFVFHDIDTDAQYSGAIGRDFKTDEDVRIGRAWYEAELAVVVVEGLAGGEQRYELLGCNRVESESDEIVD